MQTVFPSAPTGKRPAQDKIKTMRATVDASVQELANAVDRVRASETFKAYLDTQAKFHNYSWGNTLLIYSQRPTASRVAGFGTWKKLKRHVNKGEKGIMIFAPFRFRRETEMPTGETETKEGMFFKAVHVFDVEQTDGQALPEVDCLPIEILQTIYSPH